jgi:predicted DNA-binding transcriptional regulator AlpA
MADSLPPEGGPYLPAPQVWERYGRSDRTLDRWLATPALEFPRPIVINNRRYFSEPALAAWERKQASRAT